MASEIKTATVSKEKPKRRGLRWLIPFLMVAMLVSMAGAVAAIHFRRAGEGERERVVDVRQFQLGAGDGRRE